MFEEYSDDLFEGMIKVEFPIPVSKEDEIEVTEEELSDKLSLKFERMPLSLFQQTLEFLKWCHQEKKSEGFVAHRYIDGKWENVVFPQWVTATSVCYHPELLIEKSTRVVGDTHAHPPKEGGSGGSFHSHTDSLDERKNNGIFVVVTGWTPMTCDPDIVGCVRGKRFHLKPESLFDLTQYDPNPSFPEEWKNMVGSTPCKGCERKRDLEKIGKEANEKKLAYEHDKQFRLVPQAVLEVWRTEVAKDKETLGKKVREAIKDATSRLTGSSWLRLLRCDNHGCKKLCNTVSCSECNKTILRDKIIDSIVDLLDEHEAVTQNPQELALIREVIEEDMKPKELPPVVIGPTPSSATGPGGSGHTHPMSTTSTPGTTAADNSSKKPETNHLLVVSTGKACTADCVYKEYPHRHSESSSLLEKVFSEIVEGKPRMNCSNHEGRCLYPETVACDNGCVFSRTSSQATPPGGVDSKASDHLLPKCEMAACIEKGHTYYSCDIKRSLDTAAKMCPGKQCELSGHSWNACEYKILMIRLIASGRMKPPVKKDDETKRFEKCMDAGCKAVAHSRLNCPERSGPDACTVKYCQDNDHKYRVDCPIYKQREREKPEGEACKSVPCQNSNHYNPPVAHHCPIYARRNDKPREGPGSPAPYSYTPPPSVSEVTIVGETVVCPGPSCNYHSKPHKHELSTSGTSAEAEKTPAAKAEEATWPHDIGC
jgi:hypothetical protein